MTTYDQEPFKISIMSLCHSCFNIKEKCSLVSKTCNTDSKIGKGYVSRCSRYNISMIEKNKESYIVKVDNSVDSRIDMMGGGYKDVESV